MGKRTSAHEYRRTGRGGQGIANIDITERNGAVVTTFPVATSDQIMLVTDGGQVIRTNIDEIRIAGRRTQGVWVFRVEDDEKVVSVSLIAEDENGDDDAAAAEQGNDDDDQKNNVINSDQEGSAGDDASESDPDPSKD
jgi:DNA gyrase subunit A